MDYSLKKWQYKDVIVEYGNGFESPAFADHSIGVITWNTDFDYLEDSIKNFILLHEYGHLMEGTMSEDIADNFAFENFKFTERESLRNSANTLIDVLKFNKAEDWQRLKKMLKRIAKADCIKNNKCQLKAKINSNFTGMKHNKEINFLKKNIHTEALKQLSKKELNEAAKNLYAYRQKAQRLKFYKR